LRLNIQFCLKILKIRTRVEQAGTILGTGKLRKKRSHSRFAGERLLGIVLKGEACQIIV